MSKYFWAGVLANLATTVCFGTVVALTYLLSSLVMLWGRRDLLCFFGVSNAKPNVCIFLSRMEINPGGTQGIEEVTKGYVGPAINMLEYEAALKIRGSLVVRWLPVFPVRWQQWIVRRYYSIDQLEPMIELSPGKDEPGLILQSRLSSNLILIGSSVYNKLTQVVLGRPESYFRFVRDDHGEKERYILETRSGDKHRGRSVGRELAIIQRIRIDNVTALVCAGIGAGATFDAVVFLMRNWEDYHRLFKEEDFGVLLQWNSDGDGQRPSGRRPDLIKKFDNKEYR